MSADLEVDGPWGGEGGNKWEYVPKGSIDSIFITYGEVINTIRFTSQDGSGNFEISPQFGNHEGGKIAEIIIDPKVEKLDGITGTFGSFASVLAVTSLSFTTNKGTTYGPFGNATGTAFSSKTLFNDRIIGGFYGRSGAYLDAIGVYYVQPIPKLIIDGPWGGNGGKEWYYIPKGPICGMSITYGDVINTLRFTSKDEFGHFEHSPQFGDHEGSEKAKIDIDPTAEKFDGITGTFGSFGDLLAVRTLSFTTDKGTSFGPFGKENELGVNFSSKTLNNDHIISGFYGGSGSYLDFIGVYLKPLPRGSEQPGLVQSVSV